MLSKYSFDIKIKISRKETHVCAGMSIHQVICVEPRAVCIAGCNRISVAHARAHSTKHLRTSATLPRTLHCALRGSRRRSSSLRIPPLRRKRQPREHLCGCAPVYTNKTKKSFAYVSVAAPFLFVRAGRILRIAPHLLIQYTKPPLHTPTAVQSSTHAFVRVRTSSRVSVRKKKNNNNNANNMQHNRSPE